jgi:hypothetical protein
MYLNAATSTTEVGRMTPGCHDRCLVLCRLLCSLDSFMVRFRSFSSGVFDDISFGDSFIRFPDVLQRCPYQSQIIEALDLFD